MPAYKKKFYIIILCGFAIFLALIGITFSAREPKIAISVVMPVYNTEQYLDHNIQSVLSQTLKNFEFIIVDDGSTDNSLKIIRRYAAQDARIKVYSLAKNSGAAAARNEGIKHITGEYTLFIDSDDWLKKDALEHTYQHAQKFKLDMVLFLATVFDERKQTFAQGDNTDRKVSFNHMWLDKKNLHVFSYENFPDQFLIFSKKYPWNKLIKTTLIKENNLYFDNVRHHNDSFFITMAMVHARRIGYLKERLYFYRVERENAISSDGDIDVLSVWLTLKKIKHELLVLGLYPQLRVSLNSWIAGWADFGKRVEKIDPSQHIYTEKLRELIQ